MTVSYALTVGAGVIVLVAACGGTPPHGGATAAAPPAVTAVGPIPGPPTAVNSPANPYADDRTAMGEGRQLFVRFNCSGCHGGRAGGGRSGRDAGGAAAGRGPAGRRRAGPGRGRGPGARS